MTCHTLTVLMGGINCEGHIRGDCLTQWLSCEFFAEFQPIMCQRKTKSTLSGDSPRNYCARGKTKANNSDFAKPSVFKLFSFGLIYLTFLYLHVYNKEPWCITPKQNWRYIVVSWSNSLLCEMLIFHQHGTKQHSKLTRANVCFPEGWNKACYFLIKNNYWIS